MKKDKIDISSILYDSKTLKVFSSPEAAAEAEAIYSQNQTPVERIKETVQLILRVFPKIEKSSNVTKIVVDKE